jgi:hypothetical protein
LHGARLQKQLQTVLILSVTFIWSHPWVGLNGLWFTIAFISFIYSFPNPPPRRQLFRENIFRCPSKPVLPQLFDASYAPAYLILITKKRKEDLLVVVKNYKYIILNKLRIQHYPCMIST